MYVLGVTNCNAAVDNNAIIKNTRDAHRVANGSYAERLMDEKQSQREQHLLRLLQEANRRIEELEAEKRSGK